MSTLTVPLPMLTSSNKVACVGENYRWLDLLLFWDCDKTPQERQLHKRESEVWLMVPEG